MTVYYIDKNKYDATQYNKYFTFTMRRLKGIHDWNRPYKLARTTNCEHYL